MKRTRWIGWWAACVMLWGADLRAEVFIVRQGQPQAEIITAAEPARMTRLAADELQTYVENISGARLPIVTEPSANATRIYVGVSHFTEELGLAVSDLQHGAFRMDSGSNWLALLGPDGDYQPIEPWGKSRSGGAIAKLNQEFDAVSGDVFYNPFDTHYRHYYPEQDVWSFDEAGTLNAVHEFLRGLGVRWYAPGEMGEVVPHTASIELPQVNRVVRPDFPVRNFRYGYMQHGVGNIGIWNLRLGFNPGNEILGHIMPCHGMKWVLMRPEMREAHPEFYALYNGERHDLHPCLSSEGLFEKHVAYVRLLFDHYDEPMVNIDLADGAGITCQCESCQAQLTSGRERIGRMSDLTFDYLNRVAQEVYKSHPDRMVGALAYSSYRLPPEKIDQLSPNLAITFSRRRSEIYADAETLEEYRDIRRGWLEKLPSGQLFIWSNYRDAVPANRGVPVVYPRIIAEDLRDLKGDSLGDMLEVYQHQEFSNQRPNDHGHDYDAFAINHLNLYVTSRLWWDADLDLEALLDEYYDLYYGPASAAMQEFFEYSEVNWRGMGRNVETISGALERIEAAVAVVDTDSIYGERVARVAQYLETLYPLRDQLSRDQRDDIPSVRVLPDNRLAGKELDGRLDDPDYWRPVRTIFFGDAEGNRVPKELNTYAYVRKAKNALYFGVYCRDPDMQNRSPGPGDNGEADLLKGDYIEILFETTTHSYYRLRLSPSGILEDADMGDGVEQLDWVSGAEHAVHIGEDYWSVELRVPIAGNDVRDEEPLYG
ncbi:MAG: DUF4838 domain-containing protein, partial [Kiritimatiellia bacterium]